jgi:adenylate kinase
LVILGKQGAGKGTQAVRLARYYVVPHISTGDMFRDAVRAGTEFGQRASLFMHAGELIPDEIVNGIVEERLAKNDTAHRGFVLDGFPRTHVQAADLERVLAHQGLDAVVDLVVPTELVLQRLSSRRVCSICGTNYSLQAPPKDDWTCDNCGGEVVLRDDDTQQAIARRLALYEQETAPLIEFYSELGCLLVVDGVGSVEEVSRRIIDAVDAKREPVGT